MGSECGHRLKAGAWPLGDGKVGNHRVEHTQHSGSCPRVSGKKKEPFTILCRSRIPFLPHYNKNNILNQKPKYRVESSSGGAWAWRLRFQEILNYELNLFRHSPTMQTISPWLSFSSIRFSKTFFFSIFKCMSIK